MGNAVTVSSSSANSGERDRDASWLDVTASSLLNPDTITSLEIDGDAYSDSLFPLAKVSRSTRRLEATGSYSASSDRLASIFCQHVAAEKSSSIIGRAKKRENGESGASSPCSSLDVLFDANNMTSAGAHNAMELVELKTRKNRAKALLRYHKAVTSMSKSKDEVAAAADVKKSGAAAVLDFVFSPMMVFKHQNFEFCEGDAEPEFSDQLSYLLGSDVLAAAGIDGFACSIQESRDKASVSRSFLSLLSVLGSSLAMLKPLPRCKSFTEIKATSAEIKKLIDDDTGVVSRFNMDFSSKSLEYDDNDTSVVLAKSLSSSSSTSAALVPVTKRKEDDKRGVRASMTVVFNKDKSTDDASSGKMSMGVSWKAKRKKDEGEHFGSVEYSW